MVLDDKPWGTTGVFISLHSIGPDSVLNAAIGNVTSAFSFFHSIFVFTIVAITMVCRILTGKPMRLVILEAASQGGSFSVITIIRAHESALTASVAKFVALAFVLTPTVDVMLKLFMTVIVGVVSLLPLDLLEVPSGFLSEV